MQAKNDVIHNLVTDFVEEIQAVTRQEVSREIEFALNPKGAKNTAWAKSRTWRTGSRATSSAYGALSKETLFDYIRDNPSQRGEQIAQFFGTTVGKLRPYMAELRKERQIRVTGKRRGMVYSPA